MATKRLDPWAPVGWLLYHFMVFGAKTLGFKVHGGVPVEREYKDIKPRSYFCYQCERFTPWEPMYWALEAFEGEWECVRCGATRRIRESNE